MHSFHVFHYAPVPCMHSAYYDLMDYQELHSMMLQELPPWLNSCMLLRLGGALLELSTGYHRRRLGAEFGEGTGKNFRGPKFLNELF